jgi:hypothetical protein
MPVSPATQREVEETMRTAPVELFTQAAMLVDAGTAHAAVAANSVTARRPGLLSEVIDSSRKGCWCKEVTGED